MHPTARRSPPALFILVPLYIYPLEKAWEPLLSAARAHPDVQFLAVVNPNNGPGETDLPDASYIAALRELSGVANIQPLGYVYCTYGRRTLDAIKADIDRFRGWNAQFRLDGIFVDEAPSHADLAPYMASLSAYTHSQWRGSLDKPGVVVYNPGVVAHPDYYNAADLVVCFEQSESHWHQLVSSKQIVKTAPDVSSKNVAVVHSFEGSRGGLKDYVKHVRDMGFGGIYVTDQQAGGYNRWPLDWERLAEIVDEVNTM